MGLNYFTAREILRCRSDGRLGRVITIGRLQQFLVHDQISELCDRQGLADGDWVRTPYGGYAEGFFRAAGAASIASLDASGYEGADLVHDMNTPVASDLHCRFDITVDGGSLEHIFRTDEALANAMRMTAVGGHLIIWAPANNQCGHGFYQFSPELFFSALSERTGFAIERVLLVDCVYPGVSLVPPHRAYLVQSPQEVRQRVAVMSRRPLMLLVHATKRCHLADPFLTPPQQSDYVSEWTGDARRDAPQGVERAIAGARFATSSKLGTLLLHHARGIAERRRFSLRNREFFVPESAPGRRVARSRPRSRRSR